MECLIFCCVSNNQVDKLNTNLNIIALLLYNKIFEIIHFAAFLWEWTAMHHIEPAGLVGSVFFWIFNWANPSSSPIWPTQIEILLCFTIHIQRPPNYDTCVFNLL